MITLTETFSGYLLYFTNDMMMTDDGDNDYYNDDIDDDDSLCIYVYMYKSQPKRTSKKSGRAYDI